MHGNLKTQRFIGVIHHYSSFCQNTRYKRKSTAQRTFWPMQNAEEDSEPVLITTKNELMLKRHCRGMEVVEE